jgi:aminopeptidase N
MNRDSIPGVQTIRMEVNSPEEIGTLFDGAIVYAKGACLMYMLKKKMGEDIFYAGLKDYFRNHSYGNTTGDDLWNSLQPHANFDVREFMEQWLTQPNFPIISEDKSQKSIIRGADINWQIDNPARDLSGYYLLDLNKESLSNFDTRKGQEKMRVLLDANLLSRTNNLPSHLLLDIVSSIKEQDEDIIWSLNLSLLKTLKLFFNDNHKPFELFVDNNLSPKLRQIGFEKINSEPARITELRGALISWLFHAKNQEVADFLMNSYTDDLISIDNDMRSYVLIAHLQNNFSGDLFDFFVNEYRRTEDPELRDDLETAISSVKSPEYIDTVLGMLKDTKIVRSQDVLSFYAGLVRSENSRTAAWQFLRDNWQWFEDNFNDGRNIDYYPRIVASALKTKSDLDDFTNFFAPHRDKIELTRAIAMGEEEIRTRSQIISDHEAEVLRTLESYGII